MTQSFSTKAIHEGEGGDNTTGAHNTPIYQTATFSFERAEEFAAAIELAVDPDRMNPLDSFFIPGQAIDQCCVRSKTRCTRERRNGPGDLVGNVCRRDLNHDIGKVGRSRPCDQ